MAFIDDPDALDFGFMLSYIDCSEDISGTGTFTQTNIFESVSQITNRRACFSNGVGVNNDLLTSCNIHFIVGFNSQGGGVNHGVKFTYNLHLKRICQ